MNSSELLEKKILLAFALIATTPSPPPTQPSQIKDPILVTPRFNYTPPPKGKLATVVYLCEWPGIISLELFKQGRGCGVWGVKGCKKTLFLSIWWWYEYTRWISLKSLWHLPPPYITVTFCHDFCKYPSPYLIRVVVNVWSLLK